MEVVRIRVNNHRFADDLLHPEPSGHNLQIGFPMVGQQRRQIPRVARMLCFAGIIMSSGVGEPFPAAVNPIMDVKSKKAGSRIRETLQFRLQKASAASSEELHPAPQARMLLSAPYPRNGIRAYPAIHPITPFSVYEGREQIVLHPPCLKQD